MPNLQEQVYAILRPVQWRIHVSKQGQRPLKMTAKVKQLEGLGRLLKAAGVKPASAEQMIREHLDSIQDGTQQRHAEIVKTVRALEKELVELRQSHSLSVSEIRMTTDLIHHEFEANSIVVAQILRHAKAWIAIIVLIQIAILSILLVTAASDSRWFDFGSTPATVKSPMKAGIPTAAPAQTKN